MEPVEVVENVDVSEEELDEEKRKRNDIDNAIDNDIDAVKADEIKI